MDRNVIFTYRFPAELIRVDTSAKRFERMCSARKSMLHVPLNIGEHNNLNDEVQTVKRRSRSRKPRNKRRNTIAGTDQKEIEEAVRGYVCSFVFAFSIFNFNWMMTLNNVGAAEDSLTQKRVKIEKELISR